MNLIAQNQYEHILNKGFDKVNIDRQGIFSSNEVVNIESILAKDELFTFLNKEYINQGVKNKFHWIRFSIKNQSADTQFVFEFAQTYVDSLQVYLVKNGRVNNKFPTKGLYFQENNEPSFFLNKYGYVFRVDIPIGARYDIYLRADENDGPFRTVNKLWSKASYLEQEKHISINSGLLLMFTGFVILVCILALSMFVFTRHRLYLFYLGFVITIFLNLLCLRYLFNPLIVEKFIFLGNNLTEMFGYVQMFFALHYVNHFFELKTLRPGVHRVIRWLANFIGAFFVVALFCRQLNWFYEFSFLFSKVFMLVVTLGIYFLSWSLAMKRKLMAYYFIVAYSPLVFFVGHFIFTAVGLTSSRNPVAWEYVIFIEILVFTIALAHRYYLIMKENDLIQKALIVEQEKGMDAMISAQEAERKRIAKDLHDGVVQQIGGIKMILDNVLDKIASTEVKEVSKARDLAERAAEETRSLAYQMMPKALIEVGLIPALSDLLDNYRAGSQIDVDFQYFGLKERYSNAIEITIYRIAQELLNNITKHAQANIVNFQLYENGDKLILMVEDNGVGVSENAGSGMGMKNMKSRLKTLYGTIHYAQAGFTKGTLVTVVIPLP